MSSKPRDLVQAMIRRRVAKHNKINALKIERSPSEILESFLKDFDDQLALCDSIVEKYWLIEDEPQKLLNLFQKKDIGCSLELRWHGDDISNIRLEGIKLVWSDEFANFNQLDKEVIVDIFSIYFR